MPSISRLVVPDDVADKIRKHGLTVWHVVRAVAAYGREARWDVRPIDVERGVWSCVTAFVPDREDYGR